MQTLGFIGVALVVICSLPQLIKIIRTRQVRDISLPFWILMTVGLLFQLPYAFSIKDPVWCAGVSLFFCFSLVTLLFVWRFK